MEIEFGFREKIYSFFKAKSSKHDDCQDKQNT